ncbi:hypothetical protein DM785_02480 [Deinococcus actinosclerus]|nr:hypothetical protein DM785_02480 [Deinococcus actinosclerus]
MARSRFFKDPPRRVAQPDELSLPRGMSMDRVRATARSVTALVQKHGGTMRKSEIREALGEEVGVLRCAYRHLHLRREAHCTHLEVTLL